MLEVMQYLREHDYRTHIVTGGGQDFVRAYSERIYGIPPSRIVGTAGGTKFGYGKDGKPFLTKEPKLLLNDNYAGKPEGIHLEIGQRPIIAFGNSTGDREMLEYTTAGDAPGSACSFCTMTPCVNMPTGRRKGCRIPKSAPSLKRFTMKHPARAGPSSA
jgi:hypothetical protein